MIRKFEKPARWEELMGFPEHPRKFDEALFKYLLATDPITRAVAPLAKSAYKYLIEEV